MQGLDQFFKSWFGSTGVRPGETGGGMQEPHDEARGARALFVWRLLAMKRLYKNSFPAGGERKQAGQRFDRLCKAMREADRSLHAGFPEQAQLRESLFVHIMQKEIAGLADDVFRQVLQLFVQQVQASIHDLDHPLFFELRDGAALRRELVALYAGMVQEDREGEAAWFLRALAYALLELVHGRHTVARSLLAVLQRHSGKARNLRHSRTRMR